MVYEQAFALLKEFTMLRRFPEEYRRNLPARIRDHQRQRKVMEHVHHKPTRERHYNENKSTRYHDQLLHERFGNITPEQVANIVANDFVGSNPALQEALSKPSPSTGKLPTMQFDLFATDNPKMDSKYGLHDLFSPVFGMNKQGKLGLLTVTSGISNNPNTIRVTPDMAFSIEGRRNRHIHPDLPEKFALREVASPSIATEQARPMMPPAPTPPSEPEQPEYELPEGMPPIPPAIPPAHVPAMIERWLASQGDGVQAKSQPMDLAWRLLKGCC